MKDGIKNGFFHAVDVFAHLEARAVGRHACPHAARETRREFTAGSRRAEKRDLGPLFFDDLRESRRRREDRVLPEPRIINDDHFIGAVFDHFLRSHLDIVPDHHGTHLRAEMVSELAGLAQDLERRTGGCLPVHLDPGHHTASAVTKIDARESGIHLCLRGFFGTDGRSGIRVPTRDPVPGFLDLSGKTIRDLRVRAPRDHVDGRPVLLDIHDLRDKRRRTGQAHHADIRAGLLERPDLHFCASRADRSFE
ncbi:MAG: hypothetical protein BWY49_00074 [Candidatus Omnitrophica bacterium ADurb.Bin314]|nr:MAG: hypothetical protein BWY49_00074 [Candidatus Omnitrophica bacterium ADurb.Bin314]